MTSNKSFQQKDVFIHRAFIFNDEGYNYLKERTIIFIGAINLDVSVSDWIDGDKEKVQYNLKYKNIITFALRYDEDPLQVTHENPNEVKRARMNTYEYELFHMKPGGSTQNMQKFFTHLVNHFASLVKIFTDEEMINKVLIIGTNLIRKWH
ncbi:hypothetical protein CR513_10265, partial [Mucuna pruriens]